MTEHTSKGAFKHLPVDRQPERIPISKYEEISQFIGMRILAIGNYFIPDIRKAAAVGKTTTGDLDIIIDPSNRNIWKDDIKYLFPEIQDFVSNGPQLMTVMIINGHRYMIDFILADEGSFVYRCNYAKFGTLIPAVVGSFARSLHYKFEQNGFYSRIKDSKNNYHNMLLTNDFSKALDILMLDKEVFYNGSLFTSEEVAQWIYNSPRFDSKLWNRPNQRDGQTIVTKNRKSHRAAKVRDEVQDCYDIIDAYVKILVIDNENYNIERKVLGDKVIDDILAQIVEITKKAELVITGKEIMDILGIGPGPKVGEIIKYIKLNELTHDQAVHYVQSLISI